MSHITCCWLPQLAHKETQDVLLVLLLLVVAAVLQLSLVSSQRSCGIAAKRAPMSIKS